MNAISHASLATPALLELPGWALLVSLVVLALIGLFLLARRRDLREHPQPAISGIPHRGIQSEAVRGTLGAYAATGVGMQGGIETGNLVIPPQAAALAADSPVQPENNLDAVVLKPIPTDRETTPVSDPDEAQRR